MFDWHGLSYIVKTEINKKEEEVERYAKVKKETLLCFYND